MLAMQRPPDAVLGIEASRRAMLLHGETVQELDHLTFVIEAEIIEVRQPHGLGHVDGSTRA